MTHSHVILIGYLAGYQLQSERGGQLSYESDSLVGLSDPGASRKSKPVLTLVVEEGGKSLEQSEHRWEPPCVLPS